MPPLFLLTDFGTADPFVGIMKAVISGIAPETPLVDLTHEIPPGDIRHGAVALWRTVDYAPPGSVFLIVIDPGVGTSRRAVIVNNGLHTFIAPDNGVLTFVLGDAPRAWEITSPKVTLPSPGATFHGRDIFAPAAAHAAAGVPLPEFGAPVPDLERLPLPVLESPAPGVLRGQTLHADRFGNVLTSLGVFRREGAQLAFAPWVGDAPQFTAAPSKLSLQLPDGRRIPWAHTFAEIPDGECAVILGSSGLLEIVANRRSAAQLLGLSGDEEVRLVDW